MHLTNSTISNIIYTTMNLISGLLNIIALIICLIFLCLISYRLIRLKYQQRQISIDVTTILCINILNIIIIKTFIHTIVVILPTLKKDLYFIIEFNDTFKCRFNTYLLWSMIGILYWSYTLLTFFLFIRLICSEYLWLQRSTLYLYILIPIQYILVFISLLPSFLIFKSIQPIIQETYCSIVQYPLYHLIYASCIIFYMPFSVIVIFCIYIIRKMRQSVAIRLYSQRNRRDFAIIRRILLNMIALGIVSVPYTMLYLINIIRGSSSLLIYRIETISSSIASILFSIILLFITTEFHHLLKSNKITAINNQHIL